MSMEVTPTTKMLIDFKKSLYDLGLYQLTGFRIDWNAAWSFKVTILDVSTDQWPRISAEGTSMEECLLGVIDKVKAQKES